VTAFLIGVAVAVSAMLVLVRQFAGPTLHDRALAVKTLLVRAVLICAALAVASGRSDWLDAAIALMLAAIVLVIAIAKVFRARSFQTPLMRPQEER